MKSKDFKAHIHNTFAGCEKIVERKNADYANHDDPFRNFEISTAVGVSLPRGILVRMMDKVSRISNLLDRPAKVKDESIEDSLDDLINYAAIIKAYLHDIASRKN